MIKTTDLIRPAVTAFLLSAAMIPAASALSATAYAQCQTQAKALKAEQESLSQLQAARETLLTDTEAAGEDWESAEATRLFGEGEAARADLAKAEYDGLKQDLLVMETDLQQRVSKLNQDVAAYNARCVKD